MTYTDWRARLERAITRRLVWEHEINHAPEWVVHRVHNGRTVLNRRLARHRQGARRARPAGGRPRRR